MELLAPAGGIDQLRAACRFGADAVYLACERFGMRARASNFSLETLASAVREAHNAGVKVHVACNILMHESDLRELPAFFETVQGAGVDALIISDLGAFTLAKKYAPRVELHVSTQASVANATAARAWYNLGASRVVCAREMSLDEIATMRANTPRGLAIEVFAHGAMCMAVSGRCLISSYLTGRSANRGHCTQPCRWAYTLEEEKRPGIHFPIEEDGPCENEWRDCEDEQCGCEHRENEQCERKGEPFNNSQNSRYTYIMNAKDLNMLAHIDELREAGVDSIKIEGRNKKAFYVASVVSAYRRVLDGESASSVEQELYDISHRPYGTGFFFHEAKQASDYDGYEQECIHVADIIKCEKISNKCSQNSGKEYQQTTDSKNSEINTTSDTTQPTYRITAVCRNRWSADDTLEALIPHKPAIDVRMQNLCWLPGAENYVHLEASTFVPTTNLTNGSKNNSTNDPANNSASNSTPTSVPTPIANRAMGVYTFDCTCEIPAGSYLRVRKFHRTARHA